MTAPQPAALPELPGAFGYLCDWGNDSFGLTRQTVYYDEPGSATLDDWNEYPKVHENKTLYTADQMRAYALSALQSQPAEVSDAEIDSIWQQHHVTNEAFGELMDAQAFEHAARAILALRPQAVIAKAQVPMTDEQIVGWLCEEAQHTCGQWQVVIESDNPSFIDAVREHAARAQGITAQGGEG